MTEPPTAPEEFSAVLETAGASPRTHRFEFHADGGEYFRIWIVNVCLTLLTLGVYSAWAKVRNRRYFYGCTRLAGASFDYTANPVNILKGRVLALMALVAYQILSATTPLLAAAVAFGGVFLVPWVVVQALAFNARYCVHRNLRFGFDGGYWEAFRVFVLWTLAATATFGAAYPYAAWRRKTYIVANSRFGACRFRIDARARYFYAVYVVAAVVFAGLAIAINLAAAGLAGVSIGLGPGAEADGSGDDAAQRMVLLGAVTVVYVLIPAAFLGVASVVGTLITNHVWQRTRLGDVAFVMEMEPARVLWIQFSNAVLIMLSAGLYVPWARVRIMGYRLSCFSVTTAGDLDAFAAGQRDRFGATGEELGQMLDLDLGL